MNNQLVAVVKNPYEKPRIMNIEKGLAPLQELVGGMIDVARLPDMDDVHGFCNDEGLLIGLEPNFYRPEWKDAIVGTAVFLGEGSEGESVSLTPEQAKKVMNYLESNHVNDFGEFFMNVQTDFKYYKSKAQSCM